VVNLEAFLSHHSVGGARTFVTLLVLYMYLCSLDSELRAFFAKSDGMSDNMSD